MKHLSILLALLCCLCASIPVKAQMPPSLTTSESGIITTLLYSGGFEDFLIPEGVTSITLTAKGASGGNATIAGGAGCSAPGGVGATTQAIYSVGHGPNQLPPCSILRFIVGQSGEPGNVEPVLGTGSSVGGGGGGTAVLVKRPTDQTFETLMVAGGGGGAYQGAFFGACVDHSPGQGGVATAQGGNGRSQTDPGQGGSSGNGGAGAYASGGGGGKFSAGSGLACPGGAASIMEGQAGQITGGAGGSSESCAFFASSIFSAGGFGYGGGGGGATSGIITGGSAGGGGGFSGGGGGGFVAGGGGGGSFIEPFSFSSSRTITAGGTSFENQPGFIQYVCSGTASIPSVTCINEISVTLDENNFAFITPSNVLLALTNDCSGPGVLVLNQNIFNCSNVGDNLISLTIVVPDFGSSTCTSVLHVIDPEAPQISCPPMQTVVLGANCKANLPDYRSLALSQDNCEITSIIQSPAPNFILADTGTINITLQATDKGGNRTSCQFALRKEDNSPPSATCLNQTVVFNGQSTIPLDPNVLVSSTSDNCGVQGISLSTNFISCQQVGQTVVVAATTTDIHGNKTNCTSQVVVNGLPCGWNQQPNGVNCEAGSSAAFDPVAQTFTLNSTNCFYASPFNNDELAFLQRQLCGDGSITVRVSAINGSSLGWAGIIMRETNLAGAKKIQLTTNLNNNVSRREIRSTTNGAAFPQQFSAQNRFWLKLVRQGNQFTGFLSANGSQWNQVMSASINMGSCIEMGLIATNFQATSTLSATFANVSYTGNSDNPPPLQAATEMNYGNAPTVNIFPNPATNEVNIDLSAYTGRQVHLTLYDLLGQNLQSRVVDAVEDPLERLPLDGYRGTYLLRLRSVGLPDVVKRLVVFGKSE